MPEYLVEAYLPATSEDSDPSADDIAAAADQVTREGRSVRLVRTLVVPADETRCYLFEAESLTSVLEAASRAGFCFERSCEALAPWPSDSSTDPRLAGRIRLIPPRLFARTRTP